MPIGPLFSTPCYGGMVVAAHFRSCLNLKEELTKQGMPHDWNVGWNESLITRGRNEMAAAFLRSDWSHLFWLDADIEFEPEDVAKVWNLGADIGVAFYAMKLPEKPLSAWKDGKLVRLEDCPKEPFEVDFAGTGFMVVKREVFEKLADTTEWYEGPQGKTYAFYLDPIHNHGHESEDYHFCRKAREAGFKVIGDPSIRLGHYGLARYGA